MYKINIKDTLKTSVGEIPSVSTKLNIIDKLGAFLVRFNVGRMKYKIKPGLYCTGNPDINSPALVTANYKLTFDILRKELSGIDAWIMVLDTKGINVWCAAGKGTFGTEELIQRIYLTGVLELIDHKTLIIPQLGAPGIEAHKVKKVTGANIKYGPVRASDIKEYIQNNFKATENMRRITFNMIDRAKLVPVEFTVSLPFLLGYIALIVILKLTGLVDIMKYIVPVTGAIIAGTILIPIFLPLIPFRAFTAKGAILGGLWAVIYVLFISDQSNIPLQLLIFILLLTPISAFLALNFTGATTYTSPSGVRKEIKKAVPIMIMSFLSGLVLLILNILKVI
jgi:hypothetical protein